MSRASFRSYLKTLLVGEDLSSQEPTSSLPESSSALIENERTLLSPGSHDAPTAGSTPLNLCHYDDTPDSSVLLEQTSPTMLKHQSQNIVTGEKRVNYSVPYQEVFCKTTEQLDENSLVTKHHSPGCDDSGVFLEEPIASSPEIQSKSAANRLQTTLENLCNNNNVNMRQYSIHEGMDSDAERSDDLGLASSSIDSADDLDGDPLPSTLHPHVPPRLPARQKPPPVPARKSMTLPTDYQKNNKYYTSDLTTFKVPNYEKPPLSKSSSSGDDYICEPIDHFSNFATITLNEKSKNILNQQKNEQSRNSFAITRSFHEDLMSNQVRDSNQDSKSDFLARTLSSSSSVKKLDVPTGNLVAAYARRNSEQPASFKWKSEECLRTAAENKWSISGRRYEKSVSVKDRIAMFSEMEANQNPDKREDLQRYGSETNIKAASSNIHNKKPDLNANDSATNTLKDSKWHSMYSISKKPVEKEVPFTSSNLKPALSIPSLPTSNETDNSSNIYSTLPIKLEVEPPKAIVSTYPETQLTSNKRYNTGLYSLQNLKNTENLLSKKVAGSNLLSIIDRGKQPSQKLKGLVIPDKPYQANLSKELPTIVSSDVEIVKESRRASLPVTPVIIATSRAMSLPRNKKLECVPAQRQTSLTEPPWKVETTNNSSCVVPKYSPAFKKRNLELPGSSLSPTPPSSITSPMSPPPSSPSSICSSNASSTLQQNVFQFSLSHSKPVQPLQPEKALMSPPSSIMPSDVEYEGDNSEDSSHSASPMRSSANKSNKDAKIPEDQQKQNPVQYGRPNAFTSTAKTITHQPLMVTELVKSPIPSDSASPKPKAAVYLSKTEILLKKDEPKPEILRNCIPDLIRNELISGNNKIDDQMLRNENLKSNGYIKNEDYSPINNGTSNISNYDKKNSSFEYSTEFNSGKIIFNKDIVTNGNSQISHSYITTNENIQPDVPLGKFRALPISLKETEVRSNQQKPNTRQKKNWGSGRRPHSECDESDDEDSHSTLSHRTEDSRHNTTDDYLSDATTDSFEKPGLISEPQNFQKCNDDNASTEGYLSDASTDVSIRRFANRSFDSNTYSTEDYLSDATAESPDPDWVTMKGSTDYSRSKNPSKNYITSTNHSVTYITEEENIYRNGQNIDITDLRPRRLSQQKTVLKAVVEPSGSVQKFKALTEKWEQRSDVTSPPPPVPLAITTLPLKKEMKASPMVAAIISSSNSTGKGKSTLPPSLMPRNSSEKKSVQAVKTTRQSAYAVKSTDKDNDIVLTRKSISSTSTITESTNGWNPYDEINRMDSPGHDSTGSASSSSKNTLKDDDVFECSTPPPVVQREMNGLDETKLDISNASVATTGDDVILNKSSQRLTQANLPSTRIEGTFTNEPRNRRGVDFSKNNPMPEWHKSSRPSFGSKSTFSVSDIRRSFENGTSKEVEKPTPCKKTPMPAARVITPVSVPSMPQPPTRKPSTPIIDVSEINDDVKAVMEYARNALHNEGVGSRFDVLCVVLRREGDGGGSVGITLAGGADYEVKEITVHKVIGGSIADRDGRVMKGDRVMFINGKDLRGVSHGEALHILKAPSPKVTLVLARDKTGASLQQNGNVEKEIKNRPEHGQGIIDSDTCLIELLKDATGLGFSIEGGKDSPQGDRPLLVKRVFKGGAADKDGQLEEGDEIMSISDQAVSNMTRTEAWNFLKKLPEGPVLLKTRKTNASA